MTNPGTEESAPAVESDESVDASSNPEAPAESEPATAAEAPGKPVAPRWSLIVTVGDNAAEYVETDGSRMVDMTPTSASLADIEAVITGAGITPSDLRSRVLFAVAPAPELRDPALALYAALCGFAGRRLDAQVGETALELAEFDRVLRAAEDRGRPAEISVDAQVGGDTRDDLTHVDLVDGFTPATLSVIRFTRRIRFVPAADTAAALSQLVAIAAVRARAGMDRFPFLSDGTEPATTDGDPGVCLHSIRKRAEELRRELRGDTRDAVADFVEPSPRQKRLIAAATTDLATVLTRLGSVSAMIEVPERNDEGELTGNLVEVPAWRCVVPSNHTNGDASPSARILPTHDGSEGFRCFRCLPERLDALRLVMWAMTMSPDEAADWILAS